VNCGNGTLFTLKAANKKPLNMPAVSVWERAGRLRSGQQSSRAHSPRKSLGRRFRNKPSKDMAFPHPKPRKGKYRNEDKPSSGGVVWNLFKRTINITDYRNAKNDVNRAKNPTFCALAHDPPRFTTFEPPEAASWAFQYRTAWRTPRSAAASRRTSWPRGRRCVQSAHPRGAAQGRRSKCATRQHPWR